MPNCKPGDLAVIVIARKCPENLGRYVKVVREATAEEYARCDHVARLQGHTPRGLLWVVAAPRLQLQRVVWTGQRVVRTYFVHTAQRPIADWALRPLPPEQEVREYDRTIDEPIKENESA